MNMLSILPIPSFSGLRSKAKSAELKRRDSSSNIYSQSLPSTARRFSSYEELGPLFQSLVVVQDEPKKSGSLRRHNLHQSVKAKSSSRDTGCEELDAKIARIKGQLTRLKSDHMDMTHRVDDLTSSVGQLYQTNKHRIQSVAAPPAAVAGRPCSTASSPVSGSSLESIVEGANESCAVHQQIDESPRMCCVQNNLGKPRSKSAAQLCVIRNDFAAKVVLGRKSSCKSDSVLFEQRNRNIADLNKVSAEMH